MIKFIKDLFKDILRALPRKCKPDKIIKVKYKLKQKIQAPQSMYDVSHSMYDVSHSMYRAINSSNKLEELKHKSYAYAVNPNKFKKR